MAWGETGRRLNAIFERNRDAFVNIEDGFDVHDVAWWECRNMSERGPYSTSFITECCRVILFEEIILGDGKHLFLVEEEDMLNVLYASARSRGLCPVRAAARRIQLGMGNWIRTLTAAARFAKAIVRRGHILRDLRKHRKQHPAPHSALAECDVLVAAWTKAGDFPSAGQRDLAHSMGFLPRHLRERGLKVGYIALPLDEISDPTEIHRNVTGATDLVVLPDDALRFRDLLAVAIWSLGNRARPKTTFRIAGHDLSQVARMVLRREAFDWRPVNARLLSQLGPWLAKAGGTPDAVFHVYENQTWEKGLRQGLRAALPQTRIIGCHQSPMSALYPSMWPSRAETRAGRWPDVVLTHGENGRRTLLESGIAPGRVLTAGLFRDSAFIVPRATRNRGASPVRLLCATGPGFQECCELVRKAGAAAAERPGTQVLVNFHPLTIDDFRTNVRSFAATHCPPGIDIRYSDAPIRDLLNDGFDAVLYADTNSGFEAVSSGARAINVARDHALAFDKLPEGLSRRVYSVEDIQTAIDELADPQWWPTEHVVETLMADCFAVADIDVVLSAAWPVKSTSTAEKVIQ
ncbi:MAG: hypothetical protein ABJ388_03375 [Alphaproteobacteria bacterium]|uniref:hypothetical protein n=1 Tax=Nisaea sp. TaxID=2024842 RepID=UPI0032651A14